MIDRVQILKDWIDREGRMQNWVAQQVGITPQWLNYVLRGKKPLSDKLARRIEEKLGVPLCTTTRDKTTNKTTAKRVKRRDHESNAGAML